jgi:hypothetical protein
MVTARGSTRTLKLVTVLRSPPSSSYRTLRSSLTLTLRAFVDRTKGDLFGSPTAVRATVRGELDRPLRGHDAQVEQAVVERRIVEHLDAAEQVADVAEQDAAGGPVVPRRSVDADLRLERLGVDGAHTAQHTRSPAEAILEVVGGADHRGVEAGAGHRRETLAVEAPDVDLPAVAAQSDANRLLDVLLDPEIRGEKVRGRGGEDADGHLRALARQAKSSSAIAPMPTSTPPATSSGWCMPRYMCEKATKVVTRIANVQASARPVLLVKRDVSRKTRPE